MLNRRSLRIKVMQSLFALQQCKEATYELCLEKISEGFAPDLNSMEVQDKPGLQQQKKESLKLFEKAFAAEQTAVAGDSPQEIQSGLAPFTARLDETVVRAIVGDETADAYLALQKAAAPPR